MVMSKIAGIADQPERSSRILIAEDSSITQDLLKLVLTQRGHEVKIVGDGKAALEELIANPYDVAVLDFHLPEMDGVEVVSNFLGKNPHPNRPRFIAITADVEGLLAHQSNCERFDSVVPKPVNIQDICRVVEQPDDEEEREADATHTTAPGSSASESSAPKVSRRTPEGTASPLDSLGYNFLRWPDDFDTKRFSARALQATVQDGTLDAILVKGAASRKDLAQIWQAKALHLLPIIDIDGALGPLADATCSQYSSDQIGKVADLIERFANRRARVHSDLRYTSDLGERLLGRMYVSDEPLTPRYDVSSPLLVSFDTIIDDRTLLSEAQKLVDRGLLTPSFFDRIHECAVCNSSHFNVREECPDCRSPHLSEQSYLHHYRCAYQGPEEDFRQGDDLICPKCRRELTFFGRDYDRPGTMLVCKSCGQTTSEPAIGFVCANCGTHTDGDAVRSRDIHSFKLTDQGIGFVEAGQPFLGFTQQTLRFAELPLELVVALNEEARRFNSDGTTFALLNVAYQNEREIEREHGPRHFGQLRAQYLENLRHQLGEGARVFKGTAYDYALLRNTDPNHIRRDREHYNEHAAAQLALDPGGAIAVFGPKDLS